MQTYGYAVAAMAALPEKCYTASVYSLPETLLVLRVCSWTLLDRPFYCPSHSPSTHYRLADRIPLGQGHWRRVPQGARHFFNGRYSFTATVFC